MAAPEFNPIQGSIFAQNLAFDTQTVVVSVAVQNMTQAKDESVFFKILGQDEIFALSHVGAETYEGNVPMDRFTPDNYALCIIVAVNTDGVAFYVDLLVSLLEFSANMIVMESFGIEPTDWEGNAGHAAVGPIGGELIEMEYVLARQSFYKPLDSILDMTGRLYMSFLYRPELDESDPLTEHQVGFFYDDALGILAALRRNRLGFRMLYQDTTPIRIKPYVHVCDSDGNITEVEMDVNISVALGPPHKDWWYLFTLEWIPGQKALFANVYNMSLSQDLTLVDRKCLKLDSIPTIALHNWGVSNMGDALLPPFDGVNCWINNVYAESGESEETYPIVRDDFEVNSFEERPSDYQILIKYMDFITGEILTADQDLVVEVFDRDETLIETLSASQRDDGYYETFWDTTLADKSVYKIKVSALFSGELKVSSKLVSVQ